MKDLPKIVTILTIFTMIIGISSTFFSTQKDVAIVISKVNEIEKRVDRFEERQMILNKKQDDEMKAYWSNLEYRLHSIQVMKEDKKQ